jgi:FG-GAP repeat
MRRVILSIGLLAVASCLWGRFDDLKSKTWVAKIERDEEKNQGAFGYAVTALPVPTGARIVVSAATPPSGLAVLDIDASGELTSFVGLDAENPNATSNVLPLVEDAFPESLAPLSATSFALGIPNCDPEGGDCGENGVRLVSRHEVTLASAGTTLTTGPSEPSGLDTGKWVRSGSLNGNAERDVVAVGLSYITVIMDADTTRTVTSCIPGLEVRGLAVGDLNGDGTDEIVVSYDVGPSTNEIRVYSAADITGNCNVTAASGTVTWPENQEIGLSIGQLNDSGAPELVAGKTVLLDFDGVSASTSVAVPAPTGASLLFGSKSVVGNVDGSPGNELVIGDGDANIDDAGRAGRVQVFKLTSGAMNLIADLYDPSPSEQGFFGRDIAIAPFPMASSPNNILIVGAKDTVYVYFRILESAPDLRE